jgi:hypothetical protein
MSAVPRITLVEPEPEQEHALETKALDIASQAKLLVVRDPLTFQKAGDILRLIKAMSSEVTSFFEPLKKKAHEAHKALTTAEKEKLAPLVEAETHLKRGMATFQEEEERRRREEERRLQEEANRRAEEDRLALAIEAEKAGDKESAEELLAAPVEAPVVVVRSETKAAGISFRENWKSRCIDIKALARGVADGTVPAMAILPNQSFLDNQARASKGEIKYPGVQTYSEKVVSAGRG